MWKSSWIANLFAWNERWYGEIVRHSDSGSALECHFGGEGVPRRLKLSALMQCHVKHGRFWSKVYLLQNKKQLAVLGGLRSTLAQELCDALSKTFSVQFRADLQTCEQGLRRHSESIQTFMASDAASNYEPGHQFLRDNEARMRDDVADALTLAASKLAHETPKLTDQVKALASEIDNGLATLRNQAISDFVSHLDHVAAELDLHARSIDDFKRQDRFLRHRVIGAFTAKLGRDSDPVITRASELTLHPLAKEAEGRANDVKLTSKVIRKALNVDDDAYVQRNSRFVEAEMLRGSPVLAKLNEEQQMAAIVFQDRNLLVAAAGSGKSWTLIGKIGYALTRGLFLPQDIIALAFNTEAADELNTKINSELRPLLGGANVKAHTFHALGLAVLKRKARQQRKRLKIFGSAGKRKSSDDVRAKMERALLQQIITKLKAADSEFYTNWLLFLSLCREPSPTADSFANYQEYADEVEKQRAARRNGEPAFLQAMDGEVVRSVEEMAICNWLWMHGVPYKYEKDFEPKPEGWRKFTPDFYFPGIDTWHEHFGLDEYGNAPEHFNNPKWYEEQAKRKEQWFDQTVQGRWFSTRSADYRNGNLFAKLKEELISRGVVLKRRNLDQIESQLKTLQRSDEIGLITRTLHIVRGNGFTRKQFDAMYRDAKDPFRSQVFGQVFWTIHDAYAAELEHRGEVDFDDMIIQAAKALESGDVSLPYKLIMVDEFQDLSPGRARLIKALLNQHPDQSILFGVGDDWQAINGFAGSDLGLFMGFENEFGKTWEGQISTTFRCNQGIADVSSWFVMENGFQKAKEVQAKNSSVTHGVVELIALENDEDSNDGAMAEIERLIDEIAKDLLPPPPDDPKARKASIYILGRYGIDTMKCLGDMKRPAKQRIDALAKRHAAVLDLCYKTAHSSKGLEADYVFCVGMNRAKFYNFPSTFETDPLVLMLLPQHDSFLHSEERRLFYVALTRARHKVYLMFEQRAASPFIVELMSPKYKGRVQYRGAKVLPRRCPTCRHGYLIVKNRRDGTGQFLACSRFTPKNPARSCSHKENLKA